MSNVLNNLYGALTAVLPFWKMDSGENEATTSSQMDSANTPRQERRKSSKRVVIREERNTIQIEDDDETTCCHRVTLCNDKIRTTPVSNVVINIFGRKITWARIFWLITVLISIFLGWAVLFFLLGNTMLPGGPSCGLFLLVVFAYLLGWALPYIPYLNLPPTCGMLLAGIIMRNTDYFNIYEELGVNITSKIRTFCMTFVMIRAGFQITTTALKNHAALIIVLSLVPCSVEVVVLAVCCKTLLNYPWDWSFMSGAVVSCLAPVIVVNGMIGLAESGYGEDKGLTTLLSTAATIDDVYILLLFSTLYSVAFAKDASSHEWWYNALSGFRDVALGLVAGTLLGLCLTFFPHRNDKYAIWYRVIGLVLASVMCTTAATKLSITGAGLLATFVAAFIAIKGWKIQSPSFDSAPLLHAAYILWHLVQPVLVGVIGADIDFRTWSADRFGLHVGSIVLGLMARSLAAFTSTMWSHFSWKERIFVVMAWLPKGSMQAALAPMAYERAKGEDDPEKTELALDLVRISVTAIVFLAALGSMAISVTGPLLLNKTTVEEQRRERQVSYLKLLNVQPIPPLKTPEHHSGVEDTE